MTLPTTASDQDAGRAPQPAAIAIPAAMKAEHDSIHRQLVRATKAPGRTGQAPRF